VRRLIWSAEASANFRSIQEYVGERNPAAAQRLALRLIVAAEGLREMPERGRPIGHGLRELTTVWPYIVRYAVDGDCVRLMNIRHRSREPL
jgi:toxin ParE1/3/4